MVTQTKMNTKTAANFVRYVVRVGTCRIQLVASRSIPLSRDGGCN